VNYFLCAGQQYAAELGYSPLPLNLVQGGLQQVNRIPGHVPTPSLANGCNNPTIKNGKLTILTNAPQPSPCDKVGEPLDCTVVNGKAHTGSGGANPTASASAGPTAGTTSGTGPAGPTGPSEGPVTGTVVNLAAGTRSSSSLLAVLTAAEILVVIAAPPVIYALIRRRRRQARP